MSHDERLEAAYIAYQDASLTLKEVSAEYWDASSVSGELSKRYERAYFECLLASNRYTEILQGTSTDEAGFYLAH